MEIAPAVPELMAAALTVGMSMAETTMLSKAWEAVSASAQMANKELIFCDHSFQFPVSTGRTRVGAHLRRQPRRRVNCKSIFLSGKIPRRLAELPGAGGARGSIGRAPLQQGFAGIPWRERPSRWARGASPKPTPLGGVRGNVRTKPSRERERSGQRVSEVTCSRSEFAEGLATPHTNASAL